MENKPIKDTKNMKEWEDTRVYKDRMSDGDVRGTSFTPRRVSPFYLLISKLKEKSAESQKNNNIKEESRK